MPQPIMRPPCVCTFEAQPHVSARTVTLHGQALCGVHRIERQLGLGGALRHAALHGVVVSLLLIVAGARAVGAAGVGVGIRPFAIELSRTRRASLELGNSRIHRQGGSALPSAEKECALEVRHAIPTA